MTVASTTNKATYSGNGTTTVFTVPFYFLAAADLQVILRSGATETVQTLTTQYTVTGAGVSSGGSVTMLTAPPSGTTLTILRNVEATQETDLLPNDRLPAESLETALDKATMLIQQLDEVADRALQYPASDAAVSPTLPAASARASKFLSFDASGNPVATVGTNATTSTFLQAGAGAVTRSVNDKLRETVSVKDFGAIGDGATDDTAAIQNAINSVSSGGIVHFPPGTYVVNGPASAVFPVDVQWPRTVALNVPASQVVFRGVKNKSIIKLGTTTLSCAIFGSDSLISDIGFSGLTFDGNSSVITAVDAYGFFFPKMGALTINDCVFQSFKRDGVLLGINVVAGSDYRCDWLSVENCLFSVTNANLDPSIGQHGIRAYNARSVFVSNNRFFSFVKSPVDFNPISNENLETSLHLVNNYFSNNDASWLAGWSSISLMGDRAYVSGNTIVGGGEIVVHAGPFGRTLRDYRIIGNSLRNVVNGIVVNQDVNSNIVVSDNHIRNARNSGIYVVNANSPPYSGTNPVIISNNLIEDSYVGTYVWTSQPSCIAIGQAQNVTVTGNQCITPRWAGISVLSGSNNINVSGNSVIGHQGQAPTDLTTARGGGIVVAPGGVSYTADVTNIVINGNFIQNFLTTAATPTTNLRTGGIVAYNDTGGAQNVTNIVIKNNVVRSGNGIGIQTYELRNSMVDGNVVYDTFGSYVDTSSIGLSIDPSAGRYSAAPASGSWERGTVVYNSAPASAGYVGWVCTTSGTFGTLTGATGSITTGTNAMTVNNAALFRLNDYITIAGVSGVKKVIKISGSVVSLDSNADATVSSAAVAYSTPVFNTFGLIS